MRDPRVERLRGRGRLVSRSLGSLCGRYWTTDGTMCRYYVADMSESPIADLIARIYRAFGHYLPSRHMRGCDCCVTDDRKRQLNSAPLRQLSADNLQVYAVKAMTTWGEPKDYEHYLPRILELALPAKEGGYPGMPLDAIMSKL